MDKRVLIENIERDFTNLDEVRATKLKDRIEEAVEKKEFPKLKNQVKVLREGLAAVSDAVDGKESMWVCMDHIPRMQGALKYIGKYVGKDLHAENEKDA